MKEQSPYEKLGVSENSSFEEIQAAKIRICEECGDDIKLKESIEAAYDSVIMDRLRLRQEGKIKVPERIRFPERNVEKPSVVTPVVNNSPNWLQRSIDRPNQKEILLPSIVFLLLVGLTIFVPTSFSFSIGLGFLANFYFLNRKEARVGRSLLITFIVLVGGISFGYLVANSLTGNNITVTNKDQLASLTTFCLFWLTSCFIR